MEYELSLLTVTLLVAAGFIGGIINTLAGGGSMLTLPALMMLGMPADLANATNRIGVLLQSLTGARQFHRHDRLDSSAILPVLMPTSSGALCGAVAASYLPVAILKPVLLGSMVSIALIMLLKPGMVAPPAGTVILTLKEKPSAAAALFLAGVYGGFVQAGVGFMLIAALAGGLRYDLARTNALKMVCTGVFSFVALAVFIVRGQVLWIPGLILATGTVCGAWLSVKFAISVAQNTLKWIVFIMVFIICTVAFFYK